MSLLLLFRASAAARTAPAWADGAWADLAWANGAWRGRSTYLATGGAISGGTATTAYVSGIRTFAYTGSGGAISGGSATTAQAHIRGYVGSGGAVSGGSAITARATVRGYTGSGGAIAGGAATTAWLKLFSFTGSGGAVSGGSAATSYGSGLTNSYSWIGSGGAVTGGSAITAYLAGQPAANETTGGWGFYNDLEAERRRKKRLKELELEDEADRLEALLIAEGKLPPNPEIDDRITVREFAGQAEAFNRRTQRAIDYALRAQTALAYQLAAREIARQVEEEELAMLLLIAAA